MGGREEQFFSSSESSVEITRVSIQTVTAIRGGLRDLKENHVGESRDHVFQKIDPRGWKKGSYDEVSPNAGWSE